jgi:sugar lactone lactonase YvrE
MAGRVVASELYLPQSLHWREDALWFTDSYGGTVGRVGSGCEVVARLPGRPGGLGWTRDGGLVVIAMERRSILSVVPGGGVAVYADLSLVMPAWAQDIVIDSLGRVYVGNPGFDRKRGEAQAPARLVRVDPDRSAHVESPELSFPNGMVLLDRGETMIVAETLGDRVTALRVGADGELSEPSVLIDLPTGSRPTGVSVDADGRIWAGCAGSGRAVAVTRDGAIDAELEVAGEGVYGVAVGGPRGRTLFLAIASLDEDLASRAPTGRIEVHDL